VFCTGKQVSARCFVISLAMQRRDTCRGKISSRARQQYMSDVERTLCFVQTEQVPVRSSITLAMQWGHTCRHNSNSRARQEVVSGIAVLL
jgi:hypothetical protein